MRLARNNRGLLRSAFSMVDVLVSMGVVGVTVTALYAGFSLGFAITQASRENLRATQIILEKFETIRLYTWDQINSNGFIPSTFTAPYAFSETNGSNGFVFRGRLTVSAPGSTNSYSDDLRLVTVTVQWRTGGLEDGPERKREMSTLVSRFGLQHYVY